MKNSAIGRKCQALQVAAPQPPHKWNLILKLRKPIGASSPPLQGNKWTPKNLKLHSKCLNRRQSSEVNNPENNLHLNCDSHVCGFRTPKHHPNL